MHRCALGVAPVIWEGLFSTFKKWQRGREEGLGMACYASYIIIYLQTPEAAARKKVVIVYFRSISSKTYTTIF